MLSIAAFSPVGIKTDIAATTVQTRTAMSVPTAPTVPLNLRVVVEGTGVALVAMGDVTVDATTATDAEAVPPGERVLAWKPTATHCSVALRAGSPAATVQIQLGMGV